MVAYLITGVAGNIGASLAEYILTNIKDSFVIGVDNFLAGSYNNLSSLLKNCNFKLYNVDCNQYESLSVVFKDNKIDYVFHYAACAGVDRTLTYPELVFSDFEGVKNVITLSRLHQVTKIAYSSSSEVYGEPISLPLYVEHSPINPTLPYAGIKALSEIYINSILKESQLKYIIFRFFNTYGKYQSMDYVIKRFISAAINNVDINILGNGLQTRTFLHVDDNVAFCHKMMIDQNCNNITVNVGSNEMVSIIELADKIKKICNSSSKIVHLPMRDVGDSRTRQPDNSFFIKNLDKKLITLDDGLATVIKSYNGSV